MHSRVYPALVFLIVLVSKALSLRMSGKAGANPLGLTLQQTMLRIKDPKVSVPFYEQNFGFKLLHKYDFPEWKFSLAFMGIPKEGQKWPEPGTKESEKALWSMEYSCLELTHNWDTEEYALGDGYGHIALGLDDIYSACTAIAEKGGRVVREPGPMKHGNTVIAFVDDPDGYKVELIQLSSRSDAA